MNNEDSRLLGLMILNHWKFLSNEQDFCMLIAWQFEMTNGKEILRELLENKLITDTRRHGTPEYALTEAGMEYIKKNKDLFFKKYRSVYRDNYYFEQLTW